MSLSKIYFKDLWARHVPDKNLYTEIEPGRSVAIYRVFMKEKAPVWAFYDCVHCVDTNAVCRAHQFALHGHDGVRRHVNRLVRQRRTDTVRQSNDVVLWSLDILSEETALRADIIDEHNEEFTVMWRAFRHGRNTIFYRDTGLTLPICCRFPKSNLYQAYRDAHTD